MGDRVTINDLARQLGLSKTLVSMVLNGKGDKYNISKDTQKRVRELAKELNYQPNHNARSLRTGKTNTIGLIVPDISNTFYGQIAKHLERKFLDAGKRLLICCTDEDPEREKEAVGYLQAGNVDGMIIATCLEDEDFYQDLIRRNVSIVLFDRGFRKSGIPAVEVNNYEASKQATEMLLEKFGSAHLLTLSPAYISPLHDRYAGFVDANNGDKSNVIRVSHDNIEIEIEQKVGPLIDKNAIRAFFVSNNSLTTALFQLIKKKGKRVPVDIAILSFDDVSHFQLTEPPISAIAQPVEEIADRVGALLITKMEGQDISDTHLFLKTSIVERQSL